MKAIETEYKKQISLEIPDLWSRIEAGVDEYEMNKAATKSMVESQPAPIPINIEGVAEPVIDDELKATETRVVNINRNRKVISIISRIAVAAASIALVSTVVLTFGNRKSESPSATMNFAASDSAPAQEAASESAAADCETDEAVMADEAPSMEYDGADVFNEESKDTSTRGEKAEATEEEASEEMPYDNNVILDITAILDGDIYSAMDVADQMIAGGVPEIKSVELAEDAPATENEFTINVKDALDNIYRVTIIHMNDETYVARIQKDDKDGTIIFDVDEP